MEKIRLVVFHMASLLILWLITCCGGQGPVAKKQQTLVFNSLGSNSEDVTRERMIDNFSARVQEDTFLLDSHSFFSGLQRVMAWCMRLITNCRMNHQ
jgi:hypothetical protein